MAKEKMSIEKKTKLIYSIELLVFVAIFIVIATLEILGIIGKREIMLIIFNWVTIFGGTWLIVDFFWVLFSKKRRKKNSLLDKALLLPLAVYFITFDILCFCNLSFITLEFRRLMMAIGFYYVAAIYLFQAIYHYYKPVPMMLQAIEEAKQEEEKEKQADLPKEEQPAEEANNEEEKPQD